MAWLGFTLVMLAWALLILGLPRHHEAVLRRRPAPQHARLLRIGGWLLLCASLACFVVGIGWEQGPIFWAVTLMLTAIAGALLLTLARA